MFNSCTLLWTDDGRSRFRDYREKNKEWPRQQTYLGCLSLQEDCGRAGSCLLSVCLFNNNVLLPCYHLIVLSLNGFVWIGVFFLVKLSNFTLVLVVFGGESSPWGQPHVPRTPGCDCSFQIIHDKRPSLFHAVQQYQVDSWRDLTYSRNVI